MEKICGIYKITSPSGKIYIGQSNNIYIRWNYFYKKLHCSGQTKLYNSFIKYGVEKHRSDILNKCEEFELNKLERHYVNLFKTFNSKHGMNLKEGGEHSRLSDETKNKIRIKSIGRAHTQETKDKISKIHKGKILSAKTRMLISKNNAKIYLGKYLSKETKFKISQSHKKLIFQYDRRGNFIKEWDSLTSASSFYGYSAGNISEVCLSKRKTANGFIWKYKKL